jgi:hypothetical protein
MIVKAVRNGVKPERIISKCLAMKSGNWQNACGEFFSLQNEAFRIKPSKDCTA